MGRYSLPHGAKGIEGDDFAIQFGSDKVVFVPKSAGGKHYTFHAGPISGVIDVHETTTEGGHRDRHRTLFAIRADDLPAILTGFAPMLGELMRLVRPLRVGWMHRHNIGIARGVNPVSDDDIAATTCKRKGRLALDAQAYEQNIFVPEYLEDVYDFPDGNFALFRVQRQIGIGFKKTQADGKTRLFWIKIRDLMRLGNQWQAKFMDVLARTAIPPERYGEYPFLRL